MWIGQLVSMVGTQMQLAAVDWQVSELLKGQTYSLAFVFGPVELRADALGLGLLGLVRILPVILFGLLGGMLADTLDRRKMLIWSQMVAAAFAGILSLASFVGRDDVWLIYILSSAMAGVTAFANPARQALVPNLVPREHLTNAVSLGNTMWQLASMAGPMLAGLLLGITSYGVVYAINAFSFGAMLVALLMMNYEGAAPSGKKVGWASLIEGLRFTYQSRLIWSTMLLDFFATLFSSARTMLPIVAKDIVKTDVTGYGLLATAQSVGAAGAAIALSTQATIRKQGVVLLISVMLYGAATTLFGLSAAFWLSFLLLACIGAADTISTVIRSSLRQLTTPDNMRGRMTGVNMIFFQGGPQLGELEAGLVAAVAGVPFSIVSGGIATMLLVALVAWQYPMLRRYQGDEAITDHV